MIDESRTLEIYGYTSAELSHGSGKKVVAVCELCGAYRDVRFGAYGKRCRRCGRIGTKHSDETKNAMSSARRGRVPTKEAVRIRADARRKKAPEKAVLEKLYITDKLSAVKISNIYGVDDNVVGRWLKEAHIPIHAAGDWKRDPVSDETRKKMRDNHADFRGAKSGHYGKSPSEETREQMKESSKERWSDPEARIQISCAKQGIDRTEFDGFISHREYCHKFNKRFKEVVRERFNRICFLCPTTEEENGRKLNVHHVNYDKNCLCDGHECEFVPLCNTCHGKTNHDHDYWEALIIDKLKTEGYEDGWK